MKKLSIIISHENVLQLLHLTLYGPGGGGGGGAKPVKIPLLLLIYAHELNHIYFKIIYIQG